MQFIDLKKQYQLYKTEIDQAIHAVLDSGQFIMGGQIEELEGKLADFIGVKYCIGVSSGTDSLQIALMALDIGPGDEVITVPFTWISTVEVIPLVGARPVFVDIDPATYTIDIGQIEKAITPRTKAIIPVSLYGQMPDYETINAVASKYGITVIEDAAQSFGAERNGIKSCAAAAIGSTSFFPSKTLGCYGDGGALFTNDESLNRRMRAIRTHGGEKRHHHTCIGLNGRLDTIQAAILLAKLPHFKSELQAREKIGMRYTELLRDCCITPKVENENRHVYHQYTIRTPYRDELANDLQKKGIPTAIHYQKCIHEQPAFSYLGYDPDSFPCAEAASKEVISLPMHPFLTDKDQDLIAEAIKSILLEKAAAW